MYSFQELPLKDIVSGLNDAKIKVTENAIKNPKPTLIKNVFKTYYMFLTNLNAQQISRPDLQVCDNADDELISGFEFLNCFNKLKEILEAAGIRDFSLKDFYAPKEKRLTHVFSGLMNFAFFEKLRFNEYIENNNKKQDLQAMNQELQKSIDEMEIEVKNQQEKLQERAKQLEELRSTQTTLSCHISEYEMGQREYQSEINKLNKKFNDMQIQKSELENNIVTKNQLIEQMNQVLLLNPQELEDCVQKASDELDRVQLEAISYEKLVKKSKDRLDFINKNRIKLTDSVEKCFPITKDIKKQRELEANSRDLDEKRQQLAEMRRRVEELEQMKLTLEKEKQKQEAEFSEINQKIKTQKDKQKKLKNQKKNSGFKAEDKLVDMTNTIEEYLGSLSRAMEKIDNANM
ncbi:kinetochore-associated Ndc80 complex subunit nuf2 [Tritrichomonas musculus]|uniref:Kinetochore-associated Ndc80 complex subunit nuf2 n=1 Tax=Tritrichomonas musculus TaxID=1915356 RepID=A0ABR2HFU6_9EUKA